MSNHKKDTGREHQPADTDFLISLVDNVGEKVMEIYESGDFSITKKRSSSDGYVSPLTKADTLAHTMIVDALEEKYPGVAIVSEEQPEEDSIHAAKSKEVWVIDPIDGTKGLVDKTGYFSINICLLRNHRPVEGFVYAPAKDELYYTQGGRAYMRRNGTTEQIRTSESTKVSTAVASKHHLDEKTIAFLRQFGEVKTISVTSSLKFCRVASGEAEIYPRLAPTTMEWDVAAADAILRAAGGRIIDLNGKDLTYGKAGLRNLGFVAHAPNISFNIPK